jgi:hypothetical protein
MAMTIATLRRALSLVPLLVLMACGPSEPPPVVVPMDVGGGHGSEFGNVSATVAPDEYTDADGDHCPVFVTDRPLTTTAVLRIRSASCPLKDVPGAMIAIELDRRIVAVAPSLPGQEGSSQPTDTAQ